MVIQFITENGVPYVIVDGSPIGVTSALIEQGEDAAAESEMMFLKFVHEWTLSVDGRSKAALASADKRALQEAFL